MAKINLEKHRALEEEGYLKIKPHPTAPLLIHNYTNQTQYQQHWTPETMASRGLITNLEGHVVARPFTKFFNLDEHIKIVGPLPEGQSFEVFEKIDGSLGILYFWDGEPHIATRGSFNSEQCIKANQILQEKYSQISFDSEITYLFEIIYPKNRIVVDYKGMEDLILLGMIRTETGEELPLQDLGIPTVNKHCEGIQDISAIQKMQQENREGFVIRFENGLRVKIKFPEYVRLHRTICGTNARVIWRYMKEKGVDAAVEDSTFVENVPDEFFDWVKGVWDDLRKKFREIEELCRSEHKTFATRREAARYIQSETTYPSIQFKMLDGHSYDELIWRLIEPEQGMSDGVK